MSGEQEVLDRFGTLLIREVRDEAIEDWDMIMDGRYHSEYSQRIREMLGSFSPEQLAVLHRLIPKIVDTTLHHLLWTIERTEWIDVVVRLEPETVMSVRDVSDGLTGELHNAEGWIGRFSEQRYEPLFSP